MEAAYEALKKENEELRGETQCLTTKLYMERMLNARFLSMGFVDAEECRNCKAVKYSAKGGSPKFIFDNGEILTYSDDWFCSKCDGWICPKHYSDENGASKCRECDGKRKGPKRHTVQ